MAKRGSNIYKRKDGRFEGRVPVGYHNNGKIKYKSVCARTLAEVKEKMAELYSVKQGFHTAASTITVSEAAEQWLTSVKLRVKESSYTSYKNIVLKHILPFLGGEYMTHMTTTRINNYIHYKLNHGRLNGKGGLSAKSVRDIMTVYRSIESYVAREYDIRQTNFTMPKTEKKQTEVLTNAERKRLEAYLLHNMNDTNFSVLLCLFTGLRIGELCGLKWSDIDLINETISVQRTVQRINLHGKSEVIVGSPKSKTSIRIVPIPSFISDILKERRKNGEVFIISGKCKPVEPRTMQNRFKSILKTCGIRNVNFHILRHTYATVCIENGFDPKTLSELLGHADASITLNRYVHSSMQMKKNYVSRLSLMA